VFAVVKWRRWPSRSFCAHCFATPSTTLARSTTAASSTAYGGMLPRYGPSAVNPQLAGAECPIPLVSMPITS
jgi:hypothetical protein